MRFERKIDQNCVWCWCVLSKGKKKSVLNLNCEEPALFRNRSGSARYCSHWLSTWVVFLSKDYAMPRFDDKFLGSVKQEDKNSKIPIPWNLLSNRMWCSGNVSFLSVEVRVETSWKKKLVTWVGDQLVSTIASKAYRQVIFSIIITFVGSHFCSLLFWLKTIDTFWLGRRTLEYDDQFTLELFVWNLKKEKNSLQKLSLEMEISEPDSFGWNGTNINSLFVIHCYIMHSRYSLHAKVWVCERWGTQKLL